MIGREVLDWGTLDPEWEAVLEQRQIEELLEQDARSILSAASLTAPGLQDLILKEAKNVPFLLDLTLDTIEEMKRSGKEFGPEELAEREPEAAFRLAERFLRYLFPAEQDTVEVLAIPRFFDESLFKDLVTAFQTQLPLGQFREICRFSFMNERSPGIFQMHDLMRECLETRLGRRDSERLKTVHVFLFHRYDQRLEGLDVKYVGPQQEQAFLEAFHHAPEALGMEETVKWFERRSTVFFDASRWRLLLTSSEELLRMTETTLGPNHPGTWDALAELAWILQWEGGKYEEAETLLRRAIGLCEQARGKETQSAAPYLARLAHALVRREHLAEAEELFRRSVSALEVDPQRDNHAYCLALYGVALCCQSRGLFAEAENGYRQALEVAKRANDVQQGQIMLGLCDLCSAGGSYEKADEAYRETYDFFVSKYSDNNHHVAMLQANWGDLQMRRGCYNEAEALFQAALETMQRLHTNHPEAYGICHGNLGEVYLRLGRYDEAKSALAQSLCELDDSPGRSPLSRSWVTRTMGLVHLRQGQLEEAERLLDEARRDSKDSETPNIQDPAGDLLGLAELRRHQQRFSEAEEHLREALELVETNLRPDHPQAGEILLELAALREEQGRGAEASDLRTRAQRIRREAGCVS
jgi:tetratricopeptide (TPR) repeat protein